jgi:two-component system sensor histidine kinase TctE
LRRLAAGTEHETALANRHLTLARAGTPLIAPAVAVDLIGIVSDTIADHLPHALKRRHDLGFEGPSHGSPCVVRGDALLLREMLSNLVDNALRYSPDGGAITVSIDRDPGSGCYTLAVSDSGPGIPPEERERVFEPFYRGADVVAPGTGLGLAIVRTIATTHGATVSLSEANGDRGLRVTVQFPRAVQLAA